MLYALGSNGAGQLGIGHNGDTEIPSPVLFQDGGVVKDPPIKVVAGGNHTLLLYKTGEVYISGGSKQELATHTEPTAHPHYFIRLEFEYNGAEVSRFKDCAATWEASILVTFDNALFVLGVGNKGELGIGDGITRQELPHRLLDFPAPGLEIMQLASSVGHVVTVLSNGEVYGWGNGRKGQLGDVHEIVWSPRRIMNVEFPVKYISCGREFTHLVGAPEQGLHAVLGNDKWQVISHAPSTIPNWKEVAATWGSLFVLDVDGMVLAWGRNDRGQLPPETIPPVRAIRAGSEHVLALNHSGKVIAWGWGEHGNCGPLSRREDIKGRWVEIPPPFSANAAVKCQAVGAGCATSWLWIQSL